MAKQIKNEGWLISLNTLTKKEEIQKDDDSNIFKSDADALAFVQKKSKAGSLIHKVALLRVGAIFEVNIGFTHQQATQIAIQILEGKGNEAGKKEARKQLMNMADYMQQEYEKQQAKQKKIETAKRKIASKQLENAFGKKVN